MRGGGRDQVLASGSSLSAEIEKEAAVVMSTQVDQSASNQRHTVRATMKMHLVGACDGPTAARLAPTLTREEEAIRAYADTWKAIRNGDKETALKGFAPALRKKHGDAAIWSALTSYQAERGDHALTPPVLLQDEDVVTDGDTIRVRTHGSTPDRSTDQHAHADRARCRASPGGRPVRHHLDARRPRDGKGNLFELSPGNVVVRKGWPPR